MFEEEVTCWDAQCAESRNDEFDLEASADIFLGEIPNVGYIEQLEAEDICATAIEKGNYCRSDD